jgi:hypothetical protein
MKILKTNAASILLNKITHHATILSSSTFFTFMSYLMRIFWITSGFCFFNSSDSFKSFIFVSLSLRVLSNLLYFICCTMEFSGLCSLLFHYKKFFFVLSVDTVPSDFLKHLGFLLFDHHSLP